MSPSKKTDDAVGEVGPHVTGRVIERVLGVDVDVITRADLIDRVIASVRGGTRLWVANHNLHSAYLVLDDDVMRQWYARADLVFVDGMSLVAASRVGDGALRLAHRATVLDWMPEVLDAAAHDGKVVFHLGGDESWIEHGAAVLRALHPGLQLHVHQGFLDRDSAPLVVREINRVAPDLLLLGMGMPVQERFASDNADALAVPVIVTVGAFMSYAAGATSRPPRWLGQVGLEWAWRLVADPRRLARRYLIEPFFLARALRRSRPRP